MTHTTYVQEDEQRSARPVADAGRVLIGQITDVYADAAVVVWDLDNQRRYLCYLPTTADWAVAEIVRCELSADRRHIERITRVDPAVAEAYKPKRLLP